jgi:hypothetical protein
MVEKVRLLCVIAAAGVACVESPDLVARQPAGDSSQAAPTQPVAVPSVDSAALRAERAELESLKRHFTFKRDEVRGGGNYTPRATATGRATRLHCLVSESGAAALISLYAGNDWIFHERGVVRIGEQVIQTSTVSTFATHNYQKALAGGRVAEVVLFAEGSEDGGVMRAIAAADTATIRVRLEGRQNQRDFKLSDESRRSIRYCVRLADLIKKVGG